MGELCNIYLNLGDKSVLFTWIFAISYMLQIYFDFSGYSDIAIGLGKMLGFNFPENFNYPYMAKSITDFREDSILAIKNNYHDVYVYNDYLIKQDYPLNESSLKNLIDRINSIINKYLNNSKIYYSVVPDKNYFVNNGNLKMNYDLLISKMNNELSSFNYIDIMNSLSLEDYYYSDSHFKQENIVKVANVILKKMGNSYYKDINYNLQNVGVFKCVYSYQVPVKIKEDNINILSNEYIDNVIVYNNLNKIDINVYDKSKINSWDLYDIYLGGAKGLLIIYNNLASSDDELIVFRDSYGSSLVPLLISSYKKIIVIDTRYISSNILDNYFEFKGQDVLFLYSVSTINNSFTVK